MPSARIYVGNIEDAPCEAYEIEEVFRVFDPEGTGKVSIATLRHLMLEVLTPDRLSRAEFEEFLTYAGLFTGEYGKEDEVMIDYNAYISNMMIGGEQLEMNMGGAGAGGIGAR